MTKKFLFLLFVLGTYFQGMAAMPYYELSFEHFDDEFDNIDPAHLEYILDGNGIDISVANDYLLSLLTVNSSDDILPAPKMCVDRSDNDTRARLKIEGNFDIYHLSYLNMNDGSHEPLSTTSNEFNITLKHGLRLNFLTIYGISGTTRSNLYIIIIDKDLFYCDGSRFTFRQPTILNPRIAKIENFTSAPNPTFNQTSVSFYLEYPQEVSLEIIEAGTGKIIARRLKRNYLKKGNHQYDFDLQHYPAGVYIFNLRTEKIRKNISVVKLE